ncbi:MAG: winged helix-turn-helix domain-containing protein [Clostridia bacterium]|nr:winged helix-turn-helix domain-containing protein [Clostridia bacterium]
MLIVSTDIVFAEALQIALRQARIAAVISPALPVHIDDEPLLADLDCIEPTIRLPRHTITFSRFPDRGADFVRPFLFRDLTAQVLTQMRENEADTSASPPRKSDAPFLRLTPDGVLLQGRPVSLSPAERTLLALLMETPGECVPTRVIDELWEEKGGNTTAVYIRYLRKKLDEPTGLRLIRTVRGRGYCLCLPE